MNAPVIPILPVGKARAPRSSGPRPVPAQALADVREALGPDADLGRRDLLIEHLHAINDRHRQLRSDHLAALAELMRLSVTEVHEVASFYHHFEVVRPGADGHYPVAAALTVRVCDGLACEMAGAQELLARLPEILGREVRVIAAPCIGRCEQAPAVAVHQHPIAKATVESVQAAVQAGATTHEPAPYQDLAAYRAAGGYTLLAECLTGVRDVESVLQTLEHSGLRGLGGAGFPAGRKWRIVRGAPGPRLMAVNIDEGEPGTFKDRTYLEQHPHLFLEGLLIAAWAVGIEACYIYLRDEYHGCRALLERELAALKAAPPLPEGHALPAIELRRGAGAYICGEESAMIESIEGKRGMPRLRPPYVAQVGLFGRPTLEHNFETLYWVPTLLQRGAAWFAGQGRHGRKGLRSFSVSGRVAKPGVHLAPAGITLQELVDEYCGGMLPGHTLYAYLPGGASGGILPASMADIPLDFDTLQPHGCFIGSAAVMVLSDQDRVTDAARNLMAFFEHESCGQCTPCRAGTAKVRELIAQPVWDRELIADLSQVMRDASICGLGQAAPNPVDCVIKYFPQELSA
ncbi:NADH-ubiquinone oxidoreductase-F iron-sulfur binding region domain-containing protein [Aquariibacter albus]|uniref:NAD(P)H-dependent oxidoreductase subunit E n=1 Tax=Aquariibacter albus TaxID=2759899 RepID=A0A839HUN7_9BURK|nr:NADH-ubiquinone oxidoreductase-F iron-sulfur binding region domain-containing protein [Aquariibacter albus]MBB1161944.1 NAD(P)H-dependent oxidoreductase subunit E [Aquariibacter albus]